MVMWYMHNYPGWSSDYLIYYLLTDCKSSLVWIIKWESMIAFVFAISGGNLPLSVWVAHTFDDISPFSEECHLKFIWYCMLIMHCNSIVKNYKGLVSLLHNVPNKSCPLPIQKNHKSQLAYNLVGMRISLSSSRGKTENVDEDYFTCSPNCYVLPMKLKVISKSPGLKCVILL